MRNNHVSIKNVLFIPLIFLLLMAISMVGRAQEVTIKTDKLDYYPGEWVTITGSGWQAEEFVMLTLTHTGDFIPEHQHLPFDVQANGAGDLYYKWYVSDAELGTAFLLTAKGLTTGWEAETYFTDSQIDGISPSSGTEGTPFTITGVGFGSGAETFKACFGSICVDLVRVDTKTFTGVIPAGLVGGQYDVSVYNKQDNNNVGSPLENGFTYCINSTAPTGATAETDAICLGENTDISVSGGSLGTGAEWKWYTASCGGTLMGTGESINVSPTVTTTYYVRAEGTCNTTSCADVTVTVKTPSVAATSATTRDDNFCPGESTELGITGGTLGTGAVWKWYAGSCDGTSIGTGETLEVSPSVTTTYYVRAEGDCNTTICASVKVNVKVESVAATSATTSADNFCPGGKTNLGIIDGSLGTGAAWKWYTGSCGETLAGTGASIEVSPTVTTTYYVRAEGDCNTTDCASVTVNVKEVSIAATSATANVNNVCPGTEVSLSREGGSLGTGASWKWYTGSCGETLAGTGCPLKVNPTVTTTYYLRAEGDCNITDCVSITITVKKPTAITTEPVGEELVYGCDAPILSVVADGEETLKYQWYKNATESNSGGTLIYGATHSTYQTPFNYNVGTYYYYVKVTGDCGVAYSDVAIVSIVPQTAQAVGDIYYTGPSMAWTTGPNSNTATVTLSATIKNGEPCGDIRTAKITFTVNGQPIPSAQNLPVDFIDPNNPAKGGTASAIVQLNISSNTASEMFDIGVDISGNYTSGNFVPGDVTIIKPKPGGVIAGGTLLCNNNSAGYVKGFGISYLNFYVEYAMKGKSASNPKGKVNLVVASRNKPDGTIDNRLHWYTINSNAIASLNITSPTATFSAKANIAEFNPFTGATTAIEGNCMMVLDLNDVNTSGKINFSDLAGITIQRNGGGIWYSNNWENTKTVATNICGGDITVTGTNSSATLKSAEIGMNIAPAMTFEPTLKVYPNPFTEKLNIEFSYGNDTQGKLEIYSITGAKLQTLYDGPVTGGQLYNFEYLPRLVSSQMVLYHLTLDGKTQVGKILYNEKR